MSGFPLTTPMFAAHVLVAATALHPAPGPAMRTSPKDGLKYVLLPPGRFQMGCALSDTTCEPPEQPRHPIELTKAFWMGRTLVTVAAFARYARVSGRSRPRTATAEESDHPVVGVDWNQARAFCSWSEGRLPSEAEWEFAARGGRDSLTFPSGDDLSHDDANYWRIEGKDRWEETSPVTAFAPNGYGLYDMAGNVWEWCEDWFGWSYYSESPNRDPRGPKMGSLRVVRGGAWNQYAWRLRTSFRSYAAPGFKSIAFGFRCARDLPP